MADIELVIKIPDAPIQDYQDLLYKIHGMAASEGLFDDKEKSQRALALKVVLDVLGGVVNGTPLPKGHGRLIDADAIIDTLGCSDRDIYVKACIEEDAPTIIEADKGYKAEVIIRGNCMICGKELDEGLFFCKECGAKMESEG